MTQSALNILLVEDEPAEADRLSACLHRFEDAQVHVAVAWRLASALRHLSAAAVDVVLLDLSLPDASGVDACRHLRERFRTLPIVVLANAHEKPVALEALRCGAQDYLLKDPFNVELAERVLRLAVERIHCEERTRQCEEHLRLIAEQLPAVLWTTDTALRFTSSLGAGLQDLKLRTSEVVGQSLFDYFGTSDSNFPAIRAHRRALAGESVSYDLEWRGAVFHAHVEPLRINGSTIDGTIGIALDITDSRRLAGGMEAARKIQEKLLPKAMPQIAGFDIGGSSYPAEATGGDYFDFIPITDGTLKVSIGDVSGHGFGPALLMASARAYLRALARFPLPLHQTLSLVNYLVADDLDEDHFITLFLAHLDPQRRTFTYASAGHTPGAILGCDGEVKAHLASLDLPLGVVPEKRFTRSETLQLEPGDLIVLLTDGIVEAADPDGVQFGQARPLSLVRLYREAGAQQIVDNLYHAVRAYSHYQPQVDDISAVVVKVL